jgi:hypothetical protein
VRFVSRYEWYDRSDSKSISSNPPFLKLHPRVQSGLHVCGRKLRSAEHTTQAAVAGSVSRRVVFGLQTVTRKDENEARQININTNMQ